MKKTFAIIFAACISMAVSAQQPGTLTIFSEDGYRFFLILNGQRQNDKAETSIRVEGLKQPFMSCKVIFEDQGLGSIEKNITINGGMDNAPGDVTYKIKAGKDGKQVLRYFAYAPIVPNAAPARPEGVPVYTSGSTTPAQTTTSVTTTTTTMPATDMNMNGMGMNVNVNMPASGTVVQQTTTTTTTSNSTQGMTSQPSQGMSQSGCNGYPMRKDDYESAKASIGQSPFDDTRLGTAKQIAGANCLHAGQIAEICRIFTFEENKLKFAKYAYARCIDPQNYFKVNEVFTFDASRDELNKFVGH